MRAVIKLLDVWSRYQVTSRVQELVEGIYRLNRTAGLYEAINAIPNVDLAPDLRKSLINIVRKVARYREIARLLYRTAKDTTPMLRRTSVVVVDLPLAAYTKVQSRQDYVPDIVAKIDEAGTGQNHSEQEMDMLFRHLDTDRTAAAKAFGRQTRNTLAQSKIHAEIQLVEYCNSSMAK
ncbi:hypothetical protein Sste5346_001439 [Sporothrix stenoceras]|uniref:Uncharacterized protein n=1 Tax=Sporothrix stenoceras TaxID=5173 RepID=A0ABR3ZRM7_9PEZI